MTPHKHNKTAGLRSKIERGSAVCPLFLPLSGDGGVDEAFHALGVFALHAFGHMTVYIRCKSRRMMPEILLYGLGIITGLKRDGGKGMP